MLRDIAEGEGDLTKRLLVSTKDELAEMAKWFILPLMIRAPSQLSPLSRLEFIRITLCWLSLPSARRP